MITFPEYVYAPCDSALLNCLLHLLLGISFWGDKEAWQKDWIKNKREQERSEMLETSGNFLAPRRAASD